jgi:hypothetical protein
MRYGARGAVPSGSGVGAGNDPVTWAEGALEAAEATGIGMTRARGQGHRPTPRSTDTDVATSSGGAHTPGPRSDGSSRCCVAAAALYCASVSRTIVYETDTNEHTGRTAPSPRPIHISAPYLSMQSPAGEPPQLMSNDTKRSITMTPNRGRWRFGLRTGAPSSGPRRRWRRRGADRDQKINLTDNRCSTVPRCRGPGRARRAARRGPRT